MRLDFLQSSQGARLAPPIPVKRSSESFPKSARLLKHADFERVYRTGQRHSCGSLTFFFVRVAASDASAKRVGVRVGLTVGRALGGAVERNRIKRRVRAAVRKHLLQLSSPVDIVINPKKSAAKVGFAQLENEIQQGFAAIKRGEGSSAAGSSARSRRRAVR